MKRSQLAVALYAVLIFASGVVVGVVGHRAYVAAAAPSTGGRRTPEHFRKEYIEEMRSRLRLGEQQVKELNAILDATRDRIKQVRERERPEMDRIQTDQRAHIRAILSPDQLAEYEKMLAEREKRIRESRGSPPPR